MILKDDILIHIGYQKTGTSWIQQYFFNNPTIGFQSPWSRRMLKEIIVFPHSLDFNRHEGQTIFKKELDQIRSRQLFPVISHERFSGSIFSGGYDSKENADRLAAIFKRAKILIVIREQKSMLLSTYKQAVKSGYCYSLKDFLLLGISTKKRIPLFDIKRFKYHRLINYYFDLFGRENVLVLPFEMFRNNPKNYLKEILVFCDLKKYESQIDMLPYQQNVNKGWSAGTINIKRKLNSWLIKDIELNPTPFLPLIQDQELGKKIARKVNSWTPQFITSTIENRYKTIIKDYIGDFYQQSNLLTEQLIKLSLKQYGYSLPSRNLAENLK